MKLQPEHKIEDVTAASSVGFWLPSWVVLSSPPTLCLLPVYFSKHLLI